MASKVRIITVNRGEEAIIRVNSGLPITLEFPGHLVSVYEKRGLVFQRIEKTGDEETQTQDVDEIEAGPDEETQLMEDEETEVQTLVETQIDDTPSPVKNVKTPIILRDLNMRSRRRSLYQDIQDLQQDLFN
jgi:hypothetical protein